jgi:hypothetical protein
MSNEHPDKKSRAGLVIKRRDLPDGLGRLAALSEGPAVIESRIARMARSAPSAADEPLLVFGVTLTSDRDPGERDFDRAQVLVGKLNGDRPEVLVQAF